jgi:hypothetical protein
MTTELTAPNVAAELYMQAGLEILNIRQRGMFGAIVVTGDITVSILPDQMRVNVYGLLGTISHYPFRTEIGDIIMDLTSAMTIQE